MGVGGQRQVPAALPQEKDLVPIVPEVGWAPGPVWAGAENLATTGILSPGRPAYSESLYRLSYSGLHVIRILPILFSALFCWVPLKTRIIQRYTGM
jgi:hypothetical protein